MNLSSPRRSHSCRILMFLACLLLANYINAQPTGKNQVIIPTKTQKISGINTITLAITHPRPAISAMARVIDITPLLILQNQYRSAKASQEQATTSYRSSSATYERLRKLRADEGASLRQLQEARTQMDMDKTRMEATDAQSRNLQIQAVQQWGQVIAAWLAGASPENIRKKLDGLLNGDNQLLLTTFPDFLPMESSEILATYSIPPNILLRQAEPLSPATTLDPFYQGETWFFITQRGSELRNEMRLTMQLSHKNSVLGFHLPSSAVVWHANLPWIYIQRGPETFERVALNSPFKIKSGYWTDKTLLSLNDRVVSQGSQLLLSEEFRQFIPDDDDDDDDDDDKKLNTEEESEE